MPRYLVKYFKTTCRRQPVVERRGKTPRENADLDTGSLPGSTSCDSYPTRNDGGYKLSC